MTEQVRKPTPTESNHEGQRMADEARVRQERDERLRRNIGRVAGDATDASETERLKAETDSLLDEIEGVLEENAELFVKSYIQKSGE